MDRPGHARNGQRRLSQELAPAFGHSENHSGLLLVDGLASGGVFPTATFLDHFPRVSRATSRSSRGADHRHYDGCRNSTVLPSGSLTIAILTPGRISVIGMNGLMPLLSSRSSRPLISGTWIVT